MLSNVRYWFKADMPTASTNVRFRGKARAICEDGAQGRNRTTDTVIFSHVLYQLSYLGAGPPIRQESKARAL